VVGSLAAVLHSSRPTDHPPIRHSRWDRKTGLSASDHPLFLTRKGNHQPKTATPQRSRGEKSLAIYRDLALTDVSDEYEQAMRIVSGPLMLNDRLMGLYGCKGRFDGVGGPKMRPVLSREIIKGEQQFFVFFQAVGRFWVLGLVTGDEVIIGSQSGFLGRRQAGADSALHAPAQWLPPRPQRKRSILA
jgi:hypothetical protein